MASEPVSLAQAISELREIQPVNPMARRLRGWAAKAQYERLIAQVGPRYADCTLDNYDLYDGPQRGVHARLREWLDDLGLNILDGSGLLLWGKAGTGKDHLMAAAMWHATLIERIHLDWLDGTDLHQGLRAESYDESVMVRRFTKETPHKHPPAVLAISDPIPPGRALTPRGADVLFAILDKRARYGLSTWATINVTSAEEIEERCAAALVDRLRDNALVLKCDWESYRKRRAKR